jgi:hypothetical protein
MTSNTTLTSPELVITEYVEACRAGDAERLRRLFHVDALMVGYCADEYYMGTPEPFYDEVRDNPAPSQSDEDYQGEITSVEIHGNMASVTLKETSFLGASFTNWFHLSCVDGNWQIVCKSYQDGK